MGEFNPLTAGHSKFKRSASGSAGAIRANGMLFRVSRIRCSIGYSIIIDYAAILITSYTY
jgi:hypothetical protein